MNTAKISAGFEYGFACDPGKKRQNEPNQDSVELILPGNGESHPPLLIVADGMGGHLGGAAASQLVVQIMKEEYLSSTHPNSNYLALISDAVLKAHLAVRTAAAKNDNLSSMGSTVVAAVIYKNRLHVINVGDSRAYIIRGRNIIQVSQDQSWVEEQVRAGTLTIDQARGHPKRNQLTMSITAKRTSIQPYLREFNLEPDDVILLCSDGLWGTVPEALIWAATNELSPQTAADKLVEMANANLGPDNISVAIARPINRTNKSADINMGETDPGL